MDSLAVAQKATRPLTPGELRTALTASVRSDRTSDPGGGRGRMLYFATADDETPSWWSPIRDIELRRFWPTEPYLAGAIYSLCARNASFKFGIEGPPRQKRRVERLFAQMGMGRGWQHEMLKISQDLLTQDNGAFLEIIRPARVVTKEGVYWGYRGENAAGERTWFALDDCGNRKALEGEDYTVQDLPYDLPLSLAHLDAARCTRTGDPNHPVVYEDRDGVAHKLAFWQIITLEDLPSSQESYNEVGYCAVTRVMRLARVLYDIEVYKGEKIGGRFRKAIYLTNAGKTSLETAMAQSEAQADASGLRRYMQPLIVSTMDPTAQVSLECIELASLPDGFNEEETLKWYIAGLALGAGVDYGFLAPLPGRGIGTASEAEEQARTARGKSSRLFMKMLEAKLNFSGVLPRSCEFKFGEVDPEEERTRDDACRRRAETRALRIVSGELTVEVARQIAVEEGDLKEAFLKDLAAADTAVRDGSATVEIVDDDLDDIGDDDGDYFE